MGRKLELTVEVAPDPEDGGFVASVTGHPGIISDGETEEEAVRNAIDAYFCVVQALVTIEPHAGADLPHTHQVLLPA